MIKILLLILLLFFACAIAMTLLTRLLKTSQQLANLRSDLSRNNDQLQEQVRALQQEQAKQDAANAQRENNTLDPRTLEAREQLNKEQSGKEPKEL